MTDQNPQREGMERMQARYDGGGKTLLCPAGFPVPEGTKEWELIPGPKGDRGPKGDKGDRGMPTGQRRAIIYLFVLTLLLAGANLLWTGHAVNVNQSAQRRSGQLVEQKLCATLDSLRSLQPPPGNPASNPSRAYEQGLHARLSQLGTDLGCK